MANTPTLFNVNPFYSIFSICLLVGVGGYFLYQGLDRWGLETKTLSAKVISLQHIPAGKTYVTNYINGKPVVQTHATAEAYVAMLELEGEQSGGAVDSTLFYELKAGDSVGVQAQRTRFSKQWLVTSVVRK